MARLSWSRAGNTRCGYSWFLRPVGGSSTSRVRQRKWKCLPNEAAGKVNAPPRQVRAGSVSDGLPPSLTLPARTFSAAAHQNSRTLPAPPLQSSKSVPSPGRRRGRMKTSSRGASAAPPAAERLPRRRPSDRRRAGPSARRRPPLRRRPLGHRPLPLSRLPGRGVRRRPGRRPAAVLRGRRRSAVARRRPAAERRRGAARPRLSAARPRCPAGEVGSLRVAGRPVSRFGAGAGLLVGPVPGGAADAAAGLDAGRAGRVAAAGSRRRAVGRRGRSTYAGLLAAYERIQALAPAMTALHVDHFLTLVGVHARARPVADGTTWTRKRAGSRPRSDRCAPTSPCEIG